MSEDPQLGEIVAVTTTDSEPWLLVTHVEGDTIEGVLLADLARETVIRLADAVDEPERRRDLARACRRTDDLPAFTLPPDSYRDLGPLDLRGAPPFREEEC